MPRLQRRPSRQAIETPPPFLDRTLPRGGSFPDPPPFFTSTTPSTNPGAAPIEQTNLNVGPAFTALGSNPSTALAGEINSNADLMSTSPTKDTVPSNTVTQEISSNTCALFSLPTTETDPSTTVAEVTSSNVEPAYIFQTDNTDAAAFPSPTAEYSTSTAANISLNSVAEKDHQPHLNGKAYLNLEKPCISRNTD